MRPTLPATPSPERDFFRICFVRLSDHESRQAFGADLRSSSARRTLGVRRICQPRSARCNAGTAGLPTTVTSWAHFYGIRVYTTKWQHARQFPVRGLFGPNPATGVIRQFPGTPSSARNQPGISCIMPGFEINRSTRLICRRERSFRQIPRHL